MTLINTARYWLNNFLLLINWTLKRSQSAAECTWSAISRFYDRLGKAQTFYDGLGKAQTFSVSVYDNCKKKDRRKKGYPKFKKHARSVEYNTSGWKLSENRKAITFTDKNNIGKLKLKGTYDLHFYPTDAIKRVRLVRRSDGYYVQFWVVINM